MSKQPETLFKEKVQARLRNVPNSWFEKIQQVGKRGTPDILGCVNGFFVALELKIPGGRLDKLQKYTLDKIHLEAKGIAIELRPDNLDETINFLVYLGDKS